MHLIILHERDSSERKYSRQFDSKFSLLLSWVFFFNSTSQRLIKFWNFFHLYSSAPDWWQTVLLRYAANTVTETRITEISVWTHFHSATSKPLFLECLQVFPTGKQLDEFTCLMSDAQTRTLQIWCDRKYLCSPASRSRTAWSMVEQSQPSSFCGGSFDALFLLSRHWSVSKFLTMDCDTPNVLFCLCPWHVTSAGIIYSAQRQ